MEKLEKAKAALREVRFPGLEHDIVELGYVKGVTATDQGVRVDLAITTTDAAAADEMRRAIREKLAAAGLSVELAEEAPSEPVPKPPVREDLLPQVSRKIAVASGKGGVGKSTVAINLALALADLGRSVGILDADIYGPSLPTMLGAGNRQPRNVDGRIEPIEMLGLRAMSLGFLTEGLTPVIWRGPLASRALEQLMTDVNWTGIDDLILDLPPGTGDIQISIAQKANLAGAVIVTTPQDVALIDAIKGVQMFQKVGVPVLGIVENMSFFVCPECKTQHEIFPRGSLQMEMERHGVRIAGRIPIDPAIASGGDAGQPIVRAHPNSIAAAAFRELAQHVQAEL